MIKIKQCKYSDVLPFWKTEEMQMSRLVSTMMYYDGKFFYGGNDMNVFNYEYSKPTFFIAVINNKPVGCISYHIVNAKKVITNDKIKNIPSIRFRGIYVDKQYRKNGISEQLLNHAIIDSIKENINLNWSMAGPNSKRVHEKLGFVSVTEQMYDLPDGNKSLHKNCYMKLT